ncbi:hypothetical protein GPECTOR_49g457 [Gonium pectorale]|uniref:Uncharacterized protein n=1 Tax=Gonium pectorale TaxID=33097 RepID=A0A150G7R0_GONPE|nr:hypothetical protein GPECTOR_49g457 [Gonium pectorale]|eukprot:KXZ45874.1 hypothetical protein GPECTOR_49g457 [Gonium pectorale]
MTATTTVGLPLMTFKLSGHETFQCTFDRSTLPVGAFTALASEAAVSADEAAAGADLVQAEDAPQPIHGSATAGPNVVALQPSHPRYLTHALRRHPRPYYVLLSGRLPRRPAPDVNPHDAEPYFAFVLGVFKSYRTSPVPRGMTVRQAFDDWWNVQLPSTEAGVRYKQLVQVLLDNIEEDHEAKRRHTEEYNRRRKEQRAAGIAAGGGSDSDAAPDSDADLPSNARTRPDPETGDPAGADAVDEQQPDPDDLRGVTAGLDLSNLTIANLFDCSTQEGLYAYHAAARIARPAIPDGHGRNDGRFVRRGTDDDRTRLRLAQRRLKQYTAPCEEPNGVAADAHGLRLQHAPSGAAVAIVILEAGEQPLPQGMPPPYVKLPQVPTLEDTADLFTLSVEQTVPFLLLGSYFDRCRTSPSPGDPPRVLVVGGPGTGKSQFVHALLWYTFQHGHPNWLATSAYTWTAASNFNTPVHRGLSTHAMFGLTAVPKDSPKPGRDTALKTFAGRAAAAVGDVCQHEQPGGAPPYRYAANLEADPNFVPSLLPAKDARKQQQRDDDASTESDSGTEPATAAQTTDPSAAVTNSCRPVKRARVNARKQRRQDDNASTDPDSDAKPAAATRAAGPSAVSKGQHAANREFTRADMKTLVIRLNNRAVVDLATLADQDPTVVGQRNEPRHYINTCLVQLQALRLGRRLIHWNSDHAAVGRAAPALTRIEKDVATRVKDAQFGHLTADTWYFHGARFTLLDTVSADAGSNHNNMVEACGLITDPREPPDTGTGPFWQLQYLPLAVLVRPLAGHQPDTILSDLADYASHGAAFAVVPRPSEQAKVTVPAPETGTVTKLIKRINVPLGDGYALTSYAVQGFSFRDRCYVIDLTVPPHGIQRATLFVLLTRYKDLDSVHLLRPLYRTNQELEQVVDKFMEASVLSPDLAAELRLQRAAAERTRERYAAEFAYAKSLVDRREAA